MTGYDFKKFKMIESAIQSGRLAVTPAEFGRLRFRIVALKAFRTTGLYAFGVGVLITLVGYLAYPSQSDRTDHFAEYNQKLSSGTNTRIDDLGYEAESKMVRRRMDDTRTPEIAIIVGLIVLFDVAAWYAFVLAKRSKLATDEVCVEGWIAKIEQPGINKAA